MERIVECVPNFSEGRDRKKIDQIVAAAAEVESAEEEKTEDKPGNPVGFCGPILVPAEFLGA